MPGGSSNCWRRSLDALSKYLAVMQPCNPLPESTRFNSNYTYLIPKIPCRPLTYRLLTTGTMSWLCDGLNSLITHYGIRMIHYICLLCLSVIVMDQWTPVGGSRRGCIGGQEKKSSAGSATSGKTLDRNLRHTIIARPVCYYYYLGLFVCLFCLLWFLIRSQFSLRKSQKWT